MTGNRKKQGGARALQGRILVASPANEIIEIRDCLLRIERLLTKQQAPASIVIGEAGPERVVMPAGPH